MEVQEGIVEVERSYVLIHRGEGNVMKRMVLFIGLFILLVLIGVAMCSQQPQAVISFPFP
jgi:hypothetical protein